MVAPRYIACLRFIAECTTASPRKLDVTPHTSAGLRGASADLTRSPKRCRWRFKKPGLWRMRILAGQMAGRAKAGESSSRRKMIPLFWPTQTSALPRAVSPVSKLTVAAMTSSGGLSSSREKPQHHHRPAAFSKQVKTATNNRHSKNLVHSPL